MQSKILINRRQSKQQTKYLLQHLKLSSLHQSNTYAQKANTHSNNQVSSHKRSHKFFKDVARRKRGKKRSGVSKSWKADAEVFCVCGGVNDGVTSMLQCDLCKDWFHFSCVKISEVEVPKIYSCLNCKYKRVSPLDLLILAAKNLERNETSEAKSEHSETKSKTIDEFKEHTPRSFNELNITKTTFQLTRTGQTNKLVLKSPK